MPKVIIIGGGFAGVTAAKALKRADVEILLLDRSNHHVFQPLLYQVATAALPLSNISAPLREIFKKQSNVTVLMANVEKIDLASQSVKTEDGQIFAYDYLIVAPGAKHSYFGHDHWEELAPGLKTGQDAARIRERLLMAFETAERCEDPKEAKRHLNFAIIGAGPTGVEIAGSIAELTQHTLVNNFRHIKPEESNIYLIEGEGQVLPSFPKELADKALKDLEKLGIKVYLNSLVTDISPEGLYVEGQFYAVPTIIWAAGNRASPLLKTLNQPLDKQGRVFVKADLSLQKYPNVFVVGDAAALKDKQGEILPAIAPVAIQEAHYVASIIKKGVQPENREPFFYFDKGMIATIGRGRAVALFRKLQFSGYTAWLIWGFVHILYLINFKNRVLVMIHWIFLYLTGSRPDRIIRHTIRK